MVHRRCLNGTGGCSDHPYRLTARGAVEPLQTAYADDIAGRLPEGWLTAKGIQLEPDVLSARAAVYLPADANCCPSFVADMRLRVVGDSLVADSIALEPEAGGLWRIEPGKRFGPIGPETSEAQVREQFGRTSTQPSDVHIGEGFCAPGLRVFPGTPWEIEVVWADTMRARPAFVRTAAAGTEWHTPTGVRVGSTLAELERMHGGPVEFSGFGWDYGGRLRWQEDSGEVLLQLAIDPESMPRLTELASTDRRVDEISGDRTVQSDHPIVRQIDIQVTGLEIHWDRVWNSRDCE